jgi:thioredoxin reductase
MEIWTGVLNQATPNIQFSERMEEITPIDHAFSVRTNKATYTTANVLLAIGRRGTPRKLGAKGEEQPKVVYRLIEAEQYQNKYVLVVGGGDSALEAALDIANEPGTHVTLSYRGKAFDRVKPKNRARLADAIADNRIEQLLESTVQQITSGKVILKHGDQLLERINDAVIVCAGGELPTPMLKKMGVQVDTRYGE